MSKAIETAIQQTDFPDYVRITPEAPPRDRDAMRMRRSERIGSRWRVRDDALWNPFEVISFLLWLVFGFGWLMGRNNFVFVAELFLPVIALGLAVVLLQAVLRRKAGEAGVLQVLRDRIG